MSLSFGDCLKVFCSEWEYDEIAMSMDTSGNHYRTYYIKSGNGRFPALPECLAIADYMGYKYNKGYFYEKII